MLSYIIAELKKNLSIDTSLGNNYVCIKYLLFAHKKGNATMIR